MAKNPPDEKIVYLAFKDIFNGPNALLRSSTKVRNLIKKHLDGNNRDIRTLVAAHDLGIVIKTVKSLLSAEIFSSTLRAKMRFPEVFEVSPVQSAEREIAECEAARSDEVVIRDAVGGMQESKVTIQTQCIETSHKGKGKGKDIATSLEPIELVANGVGQECKYGLFQKRYALRPALNETSLYPVYLPHVIQHRLFAKVQALLEKTCYAFGCEVFPEMLIGECWDCPEDVELNIWAKIFRENEDKFDAARLAELGKPFSELLDSIEQIRHTAVHRPQISARPYFEITLSCWCKILQIL